MRWVLLLFLSMKDQQQAVRKSDFGLLDNLNDNLHTYVYTYVDKGLR